MVFYFMVHPIRLPQIPLRSTGFHYIQCHFFTSAILVNDSRGFAEITFKDLSFAAAIIIIDLSMIFEEVAAAGCFNILGPKIGVCSAQHNYIVIEMFNALKAMKTT